MTGAARAAAMEARRAEYERLQQQWTSISDRQAARFAKWREVRTWQTSSQHFPVRTLRQGRSFSPYQHTFPHTRVLHTPL
jgi:hypothetical protein